MNEDIRGISTSDESAYSSINRSMTGYSNPYIVMDVNEFIVMLRTAVAVPNYYKNVYPYNCGYFDGQKYSFDCWNLINSVLAGWSPSGVTGSHMDPNTFPAVTKTIPGCASSYSGSGILAQCSERSTNFAQINVPGTYMYMYKGHAGVYIGEEMQDGHVVNVIECTSDWNHGVQYTYVSADGGRYKYKGGPGGTAAGWTPWSEYGLLPWIEYSNYSGPRVIDVTSTVGAPSSGAGYPTTSGLLIYEAKPTQNFEYILRNEVLSPRTTPPKLTASGRVIYEDGSDNESSPVSVATTGAVAILSSRRRVKYDGRDLWYVPQSEGGWSPFDTITNESYVWSRFSEAMDPDPNNMLIGHIPCQLSRGMAIDMYRHDEDGYTRNVACAVGAVMCFHSKKKLKSAGYVCVVEEMNPNGSILTSEWYNGRFQTVRRQKRFGSWDFDNYVFQGFIHNPASSVNAEAESALDTFCRIALTAVGKSTAWIRQQTKTTANNSYSAGLIVAVSKKAGSTLNIIIPNSISVTGIGRIGILQDMGTWVDGPANGFPGQPMVGDIVIIRDRAYKKPSVYQGDIAGVVTHVGGNSFKAVQVDGSVIVEKTYTSSFSRIAGYFRPDWERVDGTTDSVRLYRNLHGLYTDGVTVEDACAREVCYLRNNLPSITRTDIRLSAVNYTGLLSNMYTVFATSSTSDAADTDLIVDLWTTTIKSWFQEGGSKLRTPSASVVSSAESNNLSIKYTSADNMLTSIYDNVTAGQISAATGINPSGCNVGQNARTAFSYLMSTGGMSQAAAIGVLANIQSESGFNTAAKGDYMWRCRACSTWNSLKTDICSNGHKKANSPELPTSFGLCQWHFGRGDRMKEVAGSNWETNLSGQLDYLMIELRGGYKGVYDAILAVPNTLLGAMQAADIFVRRFEVPANPDGASVARQSHAMTFWSNLVQ